MVSCHAFWVAISYRLAAYFTRIGSSLRVEWKFIGDRSSIFGTIITPSGKLRAKKNEKCAKTSKKLREKCVAFGAFSIFILLKFLSLVYWGHGP